MANKYAWGRRYKESPRPRLVKGCARKVRYHTESGALKSAETQKEKGRDLEPYYCGMCDGYHLTTVRE